MDDSARSVKKSGRFPRLIRNILLMIIFFVLITFSMLYAANMLAMGKEPGEGRSAVVVLGCGLNGRQVSLMLQLRLDKALEYYRDNPDTVIVASGGQGHDELIPEALAMKEYLIENGVPEFSVIMEDASGNTRENFMFTKDKLDEYFGGEDYSVVFVTNDFHILRSALYAEKAGLDAEALESPTVPYLLPQLYLREYLALIRYYALESWR